MSQHTAVGHQMITATTEMLLISDPTIAAVHAELRYYCDDPFAVLAHPEDKDSHFTLAELARPYTCRVGSGSCPPCA